MASTMALQPWILTNGVSYGVADDRVFIAIIAFEPILEILLFEILKELRCCMPPCKGSLYMTLDCPPAQYTPIDNVF